MWKELGRLGLALLILGLPLGTAVLTPGTWASCKVVRAPQYWKEGIRTRWRKLTALGTLSVPQNINVLSPCHLSGSQ